GILGSNERRTCAIVLWSSAQRTFSLKFEKLYCQRTGGEVIALSSSAERQPDAWFFTSNAVSCGGPSNPPSIPACKRGISVSSRNLSQLSRESWTPTITQPSSDGPAAWNICPSGRV